MCRHTLYALSFFMNWGRVQTRLAQCAAASKSFGFAKTANSAAISTELCECWVRECGPVYKVPTSWDCPESYNGTRRQSLIYLQEIPGYITIRTDGAKSSFRLPFLLRE
ncbi:hypothetical protein P692DRAFT_201256246 [Suillus brevipes Sb2]|nr:hypothetical protein P692DRAFT_201256246 [Suillus brevipes Sb2]